MSSNNDYFKKHLEEALTAINSDYKYIIEWHLDIEKREAPNNAPGTDMSSIDLNDKEMFIVLTPNTSKSYGDNSKTMQMEINLMCRQEDIPAAFDLLDDYQNGVVNKKYFTDDNTLVLETWYGPQMIDNSVKFRVHKGAVIAMQGSVSFTTDVVDISKVLLFNQYNKTYEVMASCISELVPSNPTTSSRKKNKNKSNMFKLDFKCKFSNTIFCNLAREWMDNAKSINVDIPLKLIYTDGYEKDYTMVINSIVVMSTDSTIPTMSVALLEKM